MRKFERFCCYVWRQGSVTNYWSVDFNYLPIVVKVHELTWFFCHLIISKVKHLKLSLYPFFTSRLPLKVFLKVSLIVPLLNCDWIIVDSLISKGPACILWQHKKFGQVYVTGDLHILGWKFNRRWGWGISFICTKFHDIWKIKSIVMA